ncbi:carbohydrate esterase family 16 protein [Sporormia fimetaria CBS 119925]|uniref:Carbohydrate esterase family 16 protein n=1 Tax=Sporormia fimetaria CBS 119925 TaxID=1340428 RepID=A0A6A6V9Y7_9PLEO|nr:carbohydrate esterase family 16 protein [Sporormia fimetaria CBS 119925]
MHTLTAVLALSSAFTLGNASPGGWKPQSVKNLVTFGDSFTDEGRLGYFINNKGSAPPVGWEQPVGLNTASGGLSWSRYASIYSKAKLYNYAVGGAVCSNKITPRFFSAINAPFPSVTEYEVPAFIADSKYRRPRSDPFFSGKPSDTVYAIWIGTNDLGNDAFLTDSQVRGKTLKDYVDCVYSIIDTLNDKVGAKYFVLLNLAPLHLLPQYATPENNGVTASQFFPQKPAYNATEISYRMQSAVTTVNEIFAYRTPFETEVSDRWDGNVKIANFDVNALLTDIWNNPKGYLNGTAEANVTGFVNQCDVQGQNCKKADSPDSFLWFDELHPSEQASRIVAREFVGVLKGKSKWAKYWA